MEDKCLLVSSRGIRKSCNLTSINPRSSSSECDLTRGSLNPGGSVYICTDALENFISFVLPKITFPFYLYTGDSDTELSDKTLDKISVRSLLESGKIRKWFAQNNSSTCELIESIPIGLDYHTVTKFPNPWESNSASPQEQEYQLLVTSMNSQKFKDRRPLILCDALLNINSEDRVICQNIISPKLGIRPFSRLSRNALWREYSKYMFVLSPEGRGLDCHRTWEAIALGCVPIVKKSALSRLFEDLPVLEVEDWSLVTGELLEKQIDLFSAFFKQTHLIDIFKKIRLQNWVKTNTSQTVYPDNDKDPRDLPRNHFPGESP